MTSTNFIPIPPSLAAEVSIISCGPLGPNDYLFTVTSSDPGSTPWTFPPPKTKNVIIWSSDFDIDLQIDTPNTPPGSSGGWKPGVNKQIESDPQNPQAFTFVWGYPANGLNNYVALSVLITKVFPGDPGGHPSGHV